MTIRNSIRFKLLLLIIFLALTILRFWRINDLFYYGIDEEYQGYLAESIVKNFHIIFIGTSAANTGFYLGPGIIYLNAFLFYLSKGDPVILGYFSSGLGVITLIIFYLVGKSLFNKKTAIIATILYGFSAWTIIYDRRFWSPTFIPLIVILFIFSFVKSLKDYRWLIMTAILLGASLHIHLSLIIFFPVVFYQLYLILKKRKKINLKIIILSVFIYLLIISPLIIFDSVHNFDNLKTPLRILLSIKGQTLTFSFLGRLWSIFNTLSRFICFRPDKTTLVISTWFCLIVVLWYYLLPKNESKRIILIFSSIYLLASLLYPGVFNDYYLISFLPIFALILADVIKNLKLVLVISLLTVFIISNLNNSLNEFKELKNKGLSIRIRLVNKTCRYLNGKSYSLTTIGDYADYGGWNYLFKHYCQPPFQSQADSMFGWIYPKEIRKDTPNYQVLLSSKSTNNQKAKKIIQEEGITSYIIKTEKERKK